MKGFPVVPSRCTSTAGGPPTIHTSQLWPAPSKISRPPALTAGRQLLVHKSLVDHLSAHYVTQSCCHVSNMHMKNTMVDYTRITSPIECNIIAAFSTTGVLCLDGGLENDSYLLFVLSRKDPLKSVGTARSLPSPYHCTGSLYRSYALIFRTT